MGEEWRPIPGYEGMYSVSSLGQVRRDAYLLGQNISRKGYGYPFVCLMKMGKKRGEFVHRLVAAAFVGPCPEGYEVNHKDRNRRNPLPDNLEYVTRSENMAHAVRHGMPKPPTKYGTANFKTKLTPDEVGAIRQSADSILVWAERLNVNKSTIARARRGDGWATVSAPTVPKIDPDKPRPWAKLTTEQVIAIRESNESANVMAERFGVGKTTISRIRRGEQWKHLPGQGIRRQEPGHRPLWAKLTVEQVHEIRASSAPSAELGQQYGVTASNIYRIKQRRTWKDI